MGRRSEVVSSYRIGTSEIGHCQGICSDEELNIEGYMCGNETLSIKEGFSGESRAINRREKINKGNGGMNSRRRTRSAKSRMSTARTNRERAL
jgi:hypothetical protein